MVVRDAGAFFIFVDGVHGALLADILVLDEATLASTVASSELFIDSTLEHALISQFDVARIAHALAFVESFVLSAVRNAPIVPESLSGAAVHAGIID